MCHRPSSGRRPACRRAGASCPADRAYRVVGRWNHFDAHFGRQDAALHGRRGRLPLRSIGPHLCSDDVDLSSKDVRLPTEKVSRSCEGIGLRSIGVHFSSKAIRRSSEEADLSSEEVRLCCKEQHRSSKQTRVGFNEARLGPKPVDLSSYSNPATSFRPAASGEPERGRLVRAKLIAS